MGCESGKYSENNLCLNIYRKPGKYKKNAKNKNISKNADVIEKPPRGTKTEYSVNHYLTTLKNVRDYPLKNKNKSDFIKSIILLEIALSTFRILN